MLFFFFFFLSSRVKNQEHKSIMQMYACVMDCTLSLTHIRESLGYGALFLGEDITETLIVDIVLWKREM